MNYPSNSFPPPLSIGRPLVSIIMPCRNAAPFVEACIRSVLAQSWDNWELLVIDNGSSDGSRAIIAAFNDPRIIVLDEPEKGVSRARNRGLERMRGEYFCFLDADDILPVHSIRLRLGLFRRYPDARFADGAMQAFNTHTGAVEWVRSPWLNGMPFDALMRMDGSCFVGNTWMVKRMLGKQYRLPEHMDHSEDHAFYFSISREGRYASTARVVLQYRKGHASANSDPLDGHKGYIALFRHIRALSPPPSDAQLANAWAHLRRIMFKDLVKAGRPWRALAMWAKRQPA